MGRLSGDHRTAVVTPAYQSTNAKTFLCCVGMCWYDRCAPREAALFHCCRLIATCLLVVSSGNSASVKINDPSALTVRYGPTCRCAATGRSGLMAETGKLQTPQVSQRLSVGAIASRSHTMSHAERPLCSYLSCAATCHLFHSSP